MSSRKKVASGITTYTEFQEAYKKSKGKSSTPAEYAKAWSKYKEKEGLPAGRKRSLSNKKKKQKSGRRKSTGPKKLSTKDRLREPDYRDVDTSKITEDERIIIDGMIQLAFRICKLEGSSHIYYDLMYEVLYNIVSKDEDKVIIIYGIWDWIDSLLWRQIVSNMPKFHRLINKVHKIFSKRDKFQKNQIQSSLTIAGVIRWLRLDATRRIYRSILARMQKIDNIRITLSSKEHSYRKISNKIESPIVSRRDRGKYNKSQESSSSSLSESNSNTSLIIKPRRSPLKKRNRNKTSPRKISHHKKSPRKKSSRKKSHHKKSHHKKSSRKKSSRTISEHKGSSHKRLSHKERSSPAPAKNSEGEDSTTDSISSIKNSSSISNSDSDNDNTESDIETKEQKPLVKTKKTPPPKKPLIKTKKSLKMKENKNGPSDDLGPLTSRIHKKK